MIALVGLFGLTGKGVLQGIEHLGASHSRHDVDSHLIKHGGNVLLFDHETYKHVLVGQLFGKALGHESVEHIVVLHGRVRPYGLETTVVIGEHQAVGTDHNARAIAREADHRVLDSVLTMI